MYTFVPILLFFYITEVLEMHGLFLQSQWRNKVAVGPRASIPKGPPFPQKNFKKQRRANFGPPTALGPRALHALHALLLRHCAKYSSYTNDRYSNTL